MPLYLSASAISDFLDCSQRYYYRTTQKEQAISSNDMLVGTIVHEMIEKYWNDEAKAREELVVQLKFFNLPATSVGKATTSLETFFSLFFPLLSEDDLIEYKFKLPLEKDVFLVGKIDRVSNGNLFDWKTSTTPPSDISKDIQFILYSEAYRRLSGSDPIAVYYASLTTGKLIKLRQNEVLTKLLFDEIIPSMTDIVTNKFFSRQGLFKNRCHFCSFKDVCYEECNYGVAG